LKYLLPDWDFMPLPPPLLNLLALGPFASWAMLGWGAAALAPILIHLWSKRRYETTPWAAMEFLLAAMKENARRIQIEQWLLLAVRTLILVLLALALAEPGCSTSSLMGPAGGGGGRTHYLLVIDGSYSMDYRDDQTSRFAHAQNLATELVQSAQQGDGFTLTLMSETPLAIIADVTSDQNAAAEVISQLRLPHTTANLAATLAELERQLKTAQREHGRLVQHRIVFYTDLDAVAWRDLSTEAVRQQLARLRDSADLIVVNVAGETTGNLAVTSLELNDPLPTVSRPVTVSATVKNFDLEAKQTELSLLVDGRVVQAQSVSVPAGGSATVQLPHRFTTAGDRAFEVRLGDDRLPIDNHRFLAVSVRESIRVLVIGSSDRASRRIAAALEPFQATAPRAAVEVAAETALLERDLRQFDALFLSNIARFNAAEVQALGRFVENGGGLVMFLGDRVQAENYNELLAQADDDRPALLPGRLTEVVAGGPHRFDPLDYEHRLTVPFRGHEQTGLLTTPVWRYWQLQPHEAARPAIAFASGDPAVVTSSQRRGQVILITTSVGDDSLDSTTDPPTYWSAFSSWPSFPPLMQEMLLLAVSGRSQARQATVGEVLSGELATAAPSAEIITPADQSVRLQMQPREGAYRWSFEETQFSGIYQLDSRQNDMPRQLYAVNLDTRESELDLLSEDDLPSQFATETQATGEVSAGIALAGSRFDWFRYLLAGMVALLLAESALAWRLGSRMR
jgi:hypothetical protein